MRSAPDISVVIPCHNADAWIGETIDSVTSQRGTSLEIILVDDGSTDRSVELARAAAGTAQLIVIQQSQSGVSRARNAGTNAARGAFIQYLDADDVLFPGTLEARLHALAGTDGDVAYCDWVKWERQPDGAFLDRDIVQRLIGDRPDIEMMNGSWWPPGALLFRREIVDAIGPWREDLPIIQDARFLLDATLIGARFVHVDQIGLKYRSHPESLSRRDPRAFLEDCYRNGSDLQARWEREGSLDAQRRHCLAGLYAYLARSFFTVDRRRFQEAADRLERLEPGFVPDGSSALRAIARIGGYPTAVRVAAWYTQLKALGQSH